jgi:hypothetical protein
MKATRIIRSVLVAGSLALLVTAPALAGNPNPANGQPDSHGDPPSNGRGRGHHTNNRGNSGHPASGHLPELDPGIAGSAALLLIGGTLVLRGRRRLEPQA